MGVDSIGKLTLTRTYLAIIRNYGPPNRGSDDPGLKGEREILGFYDQHLKSNQVLDWPVVMLKNWLTITDPMELFELIKTLSTPKFKRQKDRHQ